MPAPAVSPRLIVSRDFMVRQACLNAAAEEAPFTLHHGSDYGLYLRGFLRGTTDAGKQLPVYLEVAVCREFRKLVSKFRVAA